MIPKQVIEKAIEGGWVDEALSFGDVALDPTFWQSLGKALWKSDGKMIQPLVTARHFYDLILTGQPTEKFWEELLGSKENI